MLRYRNRMMNQTMEGVASGRGEPGEISVGIERGWRRYGGELLSRWAGGVKWRVGELIGFVMRPIPERLNLSWITADIAVGGCYRKSAIRKLAAQGITAVVDLRAEAKDDEEQLARYSVELLHLPTEDARPPSQALLRQGVDWVAERLNAGGKVYVHCQHGIGRSATLVCAVLVNYGYRPEEAVRLLKSKRWQASPTRGQIEALLEYHRSIKAATAV